MFGQENSSKQGHTEIYMRSKEVSKDMNIVPFKGKNGSYGLKDRSKDSVLIQAKFTSIFDNFQDTAFIVETKPDYYGVINLQEEILAPFCNETYFFNDYDTLINYGGVIICPLYINNKLNEEYKYFVNSKGECMAFNYYPCPYGVEMSIDNLSKTLQFIQLAEKAKFQNKPSAVYYCKKAIQSDSLNAATYFWGIKLFMNMNNFKKSSITNAEYKEYFPWIADCIEKGLIAEKNVRYLIRFNRYKKAFYKHYIDDKVKYQEACRELKRFKKLVSFKEFSTYY